MPTISAVLQEGRARLRQSGSDTPALDAEVLLRHVLRIDRTAFIGRLTEHIDETTRAAYNHLLDERVRGMPVAYLTGEREFMALPFQVAAGVLVPRPETEVLVERAIAWLAEREHATVVDVGAGSGAIALSLAANMNPNWSGRIIAVDLSPAAIAITAANRARLGLANTVALVQGSLIDWLAGPVDLLLANLPYLRPDQIDANPALAAEPRLALDGGPDGLALIRRLLMDAPRVLAPGGAIGLEIDPSQRDTVAALAAVAFPTATVAVLRDLTGLDRHVLMLLKDNQG
jgi:release factor glutamine methyltransferase